VAFESGRKVLVTGAGGSIGAALARAIHATRPRALALLDSSEQALYEIDAELSAGLSPDLHSPLLGDVGDEGLLADVLTAFRPEVIYHAAAFKHVPLMERQPVAAARNNVLATWRLVRMSARHAVARLVMVSTDKAVEPASVMGATKRIAESVACVAGAGHTDIRVIRLGNVLESRGSVAPLFRRQIAAGGPVTVTHPDARRYFLSLDDAVDLILRAGRIEGPGGVFVPVLAPPTRVVDLAARLIREGGRQPHEVPMVFTGLRPGDKMSESLVAAGETTARTSDPRLLRARPQPGEGDLAGQLARLEDAAGRRDAAAVLDLLQVMAPGYRPSVAALDAVGRPPTAKIG
jgi:FlaA1/EpsC-like NDP-sugar epimerase